MFSDDAHWDGYEKGCKEGAARIKELEEAGNEIWFKAHVLIANAKDMVELFDRIDVGGDGNKVRRFLMCLQEVADTKLEIEALQKGKDDA